jgi:hypothetical protein
VGFLLISIGPGRPPQQLWCFSDIRRRQQCLDATD